MVLSFIGPRIEASVVSCNKYLTKSYADSCGVKTMNYQYFHKNDLINIEQFPVIVKPVRLGKQYWGFDSLFKRRSSYALDVAFEFDNEIIIEPFCEGIKSII